MTFGGKRRGRKGRSGSRGAVLVEFALVFPLLVMFLLGIVTAGLAYNQKLDVTHATREGARYAATAAPGQAWASGTWASNVQNLVVSRSGGDLTNAQVCVALVVSTSASVSSVYTGSGQPATYYTTKTDGSACYSDTYPLYSANDNGLRVQVLAARPAKIELAVFPSINLTLSSSATAKLEYSP